MKAIRYRTYGPPEVARVEEVEPPSLQEGDEERVLINVHGACVNPYDIFFRRGYYPVRPTQGLLKPKDHEMGGDVAGTIAAVGAKVDRFRPGDRVFGFTHGSHAEIVRARQKNLAKIPEKVSFNEAAAVPTVALTALQALRDVAKIRPGQKVVVYGASGGIGHMAVQLAQYFGTEVTAVCSTANLGWIKELGAHEVIDYTQEDFARSGEKYDIILDSVGKRTFFNSRRALTEDGIYITEHILYPKYHFLQFLLGRLFGDRRAKAHLSQPNTEDIEFIAARLADGSLKPVIEKAYPLDQAVEAYRHFELGRTKGKIVIEVRSG